jgi:hypothetical protein
MQILFALIAVLWWIAFWGLEQLLVEDWSREAKFYFYITLLLLVGIVVWMFPRVIKRL